MAASITESATPLPSRSREGTAREASRGGAVARPTERARELRKAATPAEKRLWLELSNRKLAGHKFSRQIPIGSFIADFVCRSRKLVVELDGMSHDFTAEADERRTQFLQSQGYTVIRFTNFDVRDNLDGALQEIARALSPTPALRATPPASGRGEGTPLHSRSRERTAREASRGGTDADRKRPFSPTPTASPSAPPASGRGEI